MKAAVLALVIALGAARAGTPVRVVSANLSDAGQRWSEHGIRIVRALEPDVVLVQECNYRDGSDEAVRELADAMCGPGFFVHREKPKGIPNAIFSRWPLRGAGVWDDPYMGDREFVHAWIDLPGNVDLFAVSLHLKAKKKDRAVRESQARELVGLLKAKVPLERAYLVVGGDLNTTGPEEPCLRVLSQVVVVPRKRPADQAGDPDTNAARSQPYDWVLANELLERHAAPVRVGRQVFPAGLVFDSRVFTPLEDVPGVQRGDSGVPQMQHMPVVRAFVVP